MENNNNKLYEIALTKVDKVGPTLAKRLLQHFETPEAIFKEKKSNLLKVQHVGEHLCKSILNGAAFKQAELELNYCIKHNIDILYYKDTSFPQRLNEYADCPILLYYKGNVDLNQTKIIAIVGTREMTEYGREIIDRCISDLMDKNAMVVSGLAFGVDSHAHRQCVIHQIPTVGVLGHGLDRIYPFENTLLAKQMLGNGGLLTEFGINTMPDRENFPMRNRIVAAMSDAVIVIETKTEGGSMITADLANQYNKDVFAYPGRVSDVYSQGCNHLIKTHKAQMVNSLEDIGYFMKWDNDPVKAKGGTNRNLFLDLNEEENHIYLFLQKNNIAHVDSMHQQLNFTPTKLAGILLEMELKGLLSSLPGNRYQLCS